MSGKGKRDQTKVTFNKLSTDSSQNSSLDYFVDSSKYYKMVYEKLGREEIMKFEEDTADRARGLAALQRLYSVDYDLGTWI